MRLMAMDYFARSPLLLLPVLALGIFFGIFVVLSARALLTKKSECDDLARLPFSTPERQEMTDVRG